MKIIVQKFGGTSVNTPEVRAGMLKKIKEAQAAGYAVACVVSAMGRRGDPYATDTLIDMVLKENPDVTPREIDMIAITGEQIAGPFLAAFLQKNGVNAAYVSGWQNGITSAPAYGTFGEVEILSFDTGKIRDMMEQGMVPLVGSGQGTFGDREISMLGRGGGDTTASALGVALGAHRVEIYSNVDGVMTADPRTVEDAVLLDKITYQNCTDMAYQGAKVMHPPAVRTASKRPEMEIFVKNTTSDCPGTQIVHDEGDAQRMVGVAALEGQTLITLKSDREAAYAALERARLTPWPVDEGSGYSFALTEGEMRSFPALAEQEDIACDKAEGLVKFSVIGNHLDRFATLPADMRQAVEDCGGQCVCAYTASNHYMSLWAKADPKAVTVKLHGLLTK